MKISIILLFQVLGMAFFAKAQKIRSYFDIDQYNHTINYNDHKAVFHVQSSDQTLSFTNVEKKYYWYSGNQIQVTQGGFSGKLLNGLYSDFYLNKNLKEQGYFQMGLKNGIWKAWSEDGVLQESLTYSFGVLEGRFKKYGKNGLPSESGRYKRGMLSGAIKKYITADNVQITKYKNGLPKPKKSSKIGIWIKHLFKKNPSRPNKSKPKPNNRI